jgi:mono/diheme cytochrome c family protein
MGEQRVLVIAGVLAGALALDAAGCVTGTGLQRTEPVPAGSTTTRDFGATVHSAVAPPPISGGTLAVVSSGTIAVAADPDRDQVTLVSLDQRQVLAVLPTQANDEPGRVVEGPEGTVHVALRRGGAVMDIDVANHAVIARRPVCPAPRGMAYDAESGLLHVACAGGELVSLPAAGGAVTRTLQLDRDLRDVALDRGALFVSRFRSAELLRVAQDGTVTRRSPSPNTAFGRTMAPDVAWRTVAIPHGGVAMLHQRALVEEVPGIPRGYYGSPPCQPGIVESAVSWFGDGGVSAPTPALSGAVLAVDVAFSPDGQSFAVVAPGNAGLHSATQLELRPTQEYLSTPADATSSTLPTGGCTTGMASGNGGSYQFGEEMQVTAVAFANATRLVVQSRDPAALMVLEGTGSPLRIATGTSTVSTRIALPGDSRRDTGHEIFHANPGSTIACASCHPEGGDDGHVWHFDVGIRRTQSLHGGFRGTEPLHWDGNLADFDALVHDTFETRMSGPTLAAAQRAALGQWLDGVPALPHMTVPDAAAVQRGRALFESGTVGCASCHGGPLLTNNQTLFVGTGEALQVPSLRGVAYRAPYMHNGCAGTLAERFTNPQCGGGSSHGHTAQLDAGQLADLTAYLDTL